MRRIDEVRVTGVQRANAEVVIACMRTQGGQEFDPNYLRFGLGLSSDLSGGSCNRTALRHGGSLYFAFDSPIRPVYLAYRRGDGARQSFYFFVGQP